MDDHPVGEIGEGPLGFRLRLPQYDFCQALLVYQLCRHALEHQRQKAQAGFQRCGQGRLCHRGATKEFQAAGFELARVHAEKFIVHAPCQQAPQTRVSRRRDACGWLFQQRRINPDLGQHFVGRRTRRAALQQGFAHQMDGDRVFFRHGVWRSPVAGTMPRILVAVAVCHHRSVKVQ